MSPPLGQRQRRRPTFGACSACPRPRLAASSRLAKDRACSRPPCARLASSRRSGLRRLAALRRAARLESRGALHYAEDAKRAYDKAMVAFDEHDWEEAKALFKEVKKKYSYSRYARLAELRIADADFASEKLAEAIQGYRSFVHDHRTDPEIPYARFRICKGALRSDQRRRLPAPSARRARPGDHHRGLQGALQLRERLSGGPYATQANYMLPVVTGRLVRHELYVARFYLRATTSRRRVARTQYALRTYDGSGIEPEAMVLLGETYLKMHKPPEARSAFSQVLAKYPGERRSRPPPQNFLAGDGLAKESSARLPWPVMPDSAAEPPQHAAPTPPAGARRRRREEHPAHAATGARGRGLRGRRGASSAEEALADPGEPDTPGRPAIFDVKLPGMSGLEALERLRKDEATREVPVIVISGHATVHDAVARHQARRRRLLREAARPRARARQRAERARDGAAVGARWPRPARASSRRATR